MGIPVKYPILLFVAFLFCCLLTPFSAAFDPCECDDDAGCTELNYTAFYWGDNCTLINMELVDSKTTPRTANFTWQRTPPSDFHNNDYSIVRLKTDDSDCRASNTTAITQLPLTMLDENTTRLIDLDFETRYVVCIMPNELASQIVNDKNTTRVCERMRDCVEITTKPSLIYHYTLALYIISGFMIASVVGLIVLRVVCDLRRGSVKPDNAEDRLIVDPDDGATDDSVEEHTHGTLQSAAASTSASEPRRDGDKPSENNTRLKITAHA